MQLRVRREASSCWVKPSSCYRHGKKQSIGWVPFSALTMTLAFFLLVQRFIRSVVSSVFDGPVYNYECICMDSSPLQSMPTTLSSWFVLTFSTRKSTESAISGSTNPFSKFPITIFFRKRAGIIQNLEVITASILNKCGNNCKYSYNSKHLKILNKDYKIMK